MTMKNKLIPLLAAAAMLLGSCGSTAADTSSSESIGASISARELLGGINEELLDGEIYFGEDKFDNNAEKFFGTELSDIEDGGILYNSSGGNADEVSAVRFAEGTDGEALLKKRLEDRTATFRDYRPDELSKLEKAKVINAGGYDILIISDNADVLEKQLLEQLSGQS